MLQPNRSNTTAADARRHAHFAGHRLPSVEEGLHAVSNGARAGLEPAQFIILGEWVLYPGPHGWHRGESVITDHKTGARFESPGLRALIRTLPSRHFPVMVRPPAVRDDSDPGVSHQGLVLTVHAHSLEALPPVIVSLELDRLGPTVRPLVIDVSRFPAARLRADLPHTWGFGVVGVPL